MDDVKGDPRQNELTREDVQDRPGWTRVSESESDSESESFYSFRKIYILLESKQNKNNIVK